MNKTKSVSLQADVIEAVEDGQVVEALTATSADRRENQHGVQKWAAWWLADRLIERRCSYVVWFAIHKEFWLCGQRSCVVAHKSRTSPLIFAFTLGRRRRSPRWSAEHRLASFAAVTVAGFLPPPVTGEVSYPTKFNPLLDRNSTNR